MKQSKNIKINHFYNKKHRLSNCWIENQVVCNNCGHNHSTNVCRLSSKIILLKFLYKFYLQQAYSNMGDKKFHL